MKKVFCIILMGLLLCVAGCGTQQKAAPVDTHAFVYWTVDSLYGEFMQKKAGEWNRENPDKQILLDVRVFRSDVLNDILWTTLHSGILSPRLQAPDLVDIEYQNLAKYTPQSYCLLYSLDNQLDARMPGWKDDPEIAPYRYRELCFALPYGSDRMVVYYNEPLLKKAGIEPADIVTWEDFYLAGKKFYRETGLPLVSIDIDQYEFYLSLCLQNGIALFMDGAAREANEKAIAFLERLVNGNVAILMPGGRSDSKVFIKAFESGEIGAVVSRLSNTGRIAHAFPALDGKLGVYSLPQEGAGTKQVWLPGYATAVTTHSDDFILLKEFLAFSRSYDGEATSLKMLGAGLRLKTETAQEALLQADFASFYATPLGPLYAGAQPGQTKMPAADLLEPYLKAYSTELMKRVLYDAE